MEKRLFASELRISGDKNPKIIASIPYNSLSEDMGFRELLRPGCFHEALRTADNIMCFWNHDVSKPLANLRAGTLKLRDSQEGLHVEIYPSQDSTFGKDALDSVGRGDCAGLSFGFTMAQDGSGEQYTVDNVREILNVEKLIEVSPTSMPAYSESSAVVRKKQTNFKEGNNNMRTELFNTMKSISEYRELDKEEQTPELRAAFSQNLARAEELEKAIEKETAEEKRAAELEERMNESINMPVLIPNGTEIPEGPADSKKYRAMFSIGEDRTLSNGGFKSHEEFLNVFVSGRHDNRLIRASMGSDIASEGGFTVPESLSEQWLDSSLEDEIVRPRATVWPMTSDNRKVPGWDGADHTDGMAGLNIAWLAQKGTATRDTAKVQLISLNAKKGAIYTQISNELKDDGLGFADQLKMGMQTAIGFGLDHSFLFGSGAGEPQGMIGSANPARVVIAKEAGQSANTIVIENLSRIFAAMIPAGRKNAVWLANNDCIPQLLTMSLAVGTGGAHIPLLNESNGEFTIYGRPVIFTEKMKTLGTEGDIAFVDLSRYVIGMRKDLIIDQSNAPGWTEDMTDYRCIVRVDGQSSMSEAITPKYGTASSLSAFVTLAVRT